MERNEFHRESSRIVERNKCYQNCLNFSFSPLRGRSAAEARKANNQSVQAIPANLHANTDEQERRETKNNAHGVFSKNRSETIGKSITQKNAYRDKR